MVTMDRHIVFTALLLAAVAACAGAHVPSGQVSRLMQHRASARGHSDPSEPKEESQAHRNDAATVQTLISRTVAHMLRKATKPSINVRKPHRFRSKASARFGRLLRAIKTSSPRQRALQDVQFSHDTSSSGVEPGFLQNGGHGAVAHSMSHENAKEAKPVNRRQYSPGPEEGSGGEFGSGWVSFNGEMVCENQDHNESTCQMLGCCQWDDGECWSSVGTEPCWDWGGGGGYGSGSGSYYCDFMDYGVPGKATPLQYVDAGGESEIVIDSASVDVKAWNQAAMMGMGAAPGENMTMEIAAFTITFKSDIRLKIQVHLP